MARPLAWQIATVTALKAETARVRTVTLALASWTPHRAGQHYDVRLTAPDGYQARRSYSVASAPEHVGTIDLTVERLEEGEVSPYLHDVLIVGDQIEVRGPIGGYFVWAAGLGGPLLLIAGWSGIVPLMAMLRHRAATGSRIPTRLLYSSRTLEDVIYRAELEQLAASGTGLDVIQTVDAGAASGLDGLRTPDRRSDAARGSRAAGRGRAGLHLRADSLRGSRGPWPGSARHRAGADSHGTLWAHRGHGVGRRPTLDNGQGAMNRACMLDGNAVAGLLQEVFAVEMTASPTVCAHCGRRGAVGTLLAFTQAPGAVLRCPACEQVVLRIVETPDALYVDARRTLYLRLEHHPA